MWWANLNVVTCFPVSAGDVRHKPYLYLKPAALISIVTSLFNKYFAYDTDDLMTLLQVLLNSHDIIILYVCA